MPMRVVRRAVRNFGTPAARYPADPRAVFVLAACVVSGVASLTTGATPGSIQEQLDPVWIVAWGAMIGLGGLVTLVGTFKLNANGVILEQVGCTIVACATGVFAAAAWLTAGQTALYAGLFQLMFGVACLWRAGQLQGLINQSVRRAQDGNA